MHQPSSHFDIALSSHRQRLISYLDKVREDKGSNGSENRFECESCDCLCPTVGHNYKTKSESNTTYVRKRKMDLINKKAITVSKVAILWVLLLEKDVQASPEDVSVSGRTVDTDNYFEVLCGNLLTTVAIQNYLILKKTTNCYCPLDVLGNHHY